jgi:hypothetical protein
MARKTIEVGKILKMANAFLAAKNTTADEREVMCAFIEGVLFDTGNYMGYRYLDTDQIEGNGSRRYYYPSNAVREDFEVELRNINQIRV